MLNKKTILSLLFISTITSNLIADDKYTMEQIYNKMCIECHSSDGSGNTDKLTPSMIGQT
ncbi:MAG: cytochrome c [Campylobacterota bacterium]|nr:cytochrome c [Campylobacterota bacterium]